MFHSVSDQYKTQEICDRVVPEDPFMLIYCPDRWFVKSKMLEKFHDPLHTNDDNPF